MSKKNKSKEFTTGRVTKCYVLSVAILVAIIAGLAFIGFIVSRFGRSIIAAFQNYWSGMATGFAIMTCLMIVIIAVVQKRSEKKVAKKIFPKIEFTPAEVLKVSLIALAAIGMGLLVLGLIGVAVVKFADIIGAWLLQQWIAILLTACVVFSAFVVIMYIIYNKMKAKEAEEVDEQLAKVEVGIKEHYAAERKKGEEMKKAE